MKNLKQKRICIILSTYNSEITKKTYDIAKKSLLKLGYKNLNVFSVPGAFEIPVSISRLEPVVELVALVDVVRHRADEVGLDPPRNQMIRAYILGCPIRQDSAWSHVRFVHISSVSDMRF